MCVIWHIILTLFCRELSSMAKMINALCVVIDCL